MSRPSLLRTTSVLILIGLLGNGVRGYSLRGPSASGEGSHNKQTRSVDPSQPTPVCGSRLLEAVRGVCRNRGGFSMTRRSDPSLSLAPHYEEMEMPMSNALEDYQSDSYSEDPSDGDWWNLTPSKLVAFKVLSENAKGSESRQGNHNRFRRNIVDECCKRPCSHSHMIKYCVRQ